MESERNVVLDGKRLQLELILLGAIMGSSNGVRQRLIQATSGWHFGRESTREMYEAVIHEDNGQMLAFLQRLGASATSEEENPLRVIIKRLETIENEIAARGMVAKCSDVRYGDIDGLKELLSSALEELNGGRTLVQQETA